MMKKIIALVLLFCCLCFLSCTMFEETYNRVFEVGTLIENFCFALMDNDFETAKSYLHPNSPLNNSFIETIEKFEQENGIDFSSGVAFMYRGSASAGVYSFEFNGAQYEMDYNMIIGKTNICFSFVVVSSENNLSIYSMEVNQLSD